MYLDVEENIDDNRDNSQSGPTIGDIKIEHHPDTKRDPDIIPLSFLSKCIKPDRSTRNLS